ncbi:hypothetical protein AAHC03_024297 [Spirometra sp. Aus1]
MVKRKSLEVISEPNKKPKDPSIADEAWRKMRDAIETAFLLKCPVKRDTVCPTLNSVGLRINLHNGIGYRPVPLSNSELVNLLQKIVQSTDAKTKLPHQAKLDELVTLVQFANDEGDFGEGLELGLDLLAFHPKGENLQSASCFNNTISLLLSTGYQLAGRPQFAEVINQHMKNRCIQPTSLKTNS